MNEKHYKKFQHGRSPLGIALLIILLCLTLANAASIRNVILCIGDGMGPEHVKAARMYAGTNLCFEAFPYQSIMATLSASDPITDSAASSTAMATGVKVNSGVISLQIPGDEGELKTLLEYFKEQEKSVGLVSTTHITHATPAAFGAHATNRSNLTEIATDYLTQTKPNILFGGGANGMNEADALAAGYTVVTDTNELFALDTEVESFVSGQFGSHHMPFEHDGLGHFPHLHQMTEIALDILDNDPDGFFLMMEGGLIDRGGHFNNITNVIHETLEFSESVKTIYDWMGTREDTLILVTADHETGGLTVLTNNGPGNYPTVTWSTTGHTRTPVPVYGTGLNAHMVTNITDNTDIHALASSRARIPEQCLSTAADDSGFHMIWTSSTGDVLRLEHTLELDPLDWQLTGTYTATTTRLTISITNSPYTPRKFYRLISEESYEP